MGAIAKNVLYEPQATYRAVTCGKNWVLGVLVKRNAEQLSQIGNI
jgi:hypothetical protein